MLLLKGITSEDGVESVSSWRCDLSLVQTEEDQDQASASVTHMSRGHNSQSPALCCKSPKSESALPLPNPLHAKKWGKWMAIPGMFLLSPQTSMAGAVFWGALSSGQAIVPLLPICRCFQLGRREGRECLYVLFKNRFAFLLYCILLITDAAECPCGANKRFSPQILHIWCTRLIYRIGS